MLSALHIFSHLILIILLWSVELVKAFQRNRTRQFSSQGLYQIICMLLWGMSLVGFVSQLDHDRFYSGNGIILLLSHIQLREIFSSFKQFIKIFKELAIHYWGLWLIVHLFQAWDYSIAWCPLTPSRKLFPSAWERPGLSVSLGTFIGDTWSSNSLMSSGIPSLFSHWIKKLEMQICFLAVFG